MFARAILAQQRQLLITICVALAHGLILAWVMSLRMGGAPQIEMSFIEIDFAELEPQTPEPLPVPDTVPVLPPPPAPVAETQTEAPEPPSSGPSVSVDAPSEIVPSNPSPEDPSENHSDQSPQSEPDPEPVALPEVLTQTESLNPFLQPVSPPTAGTDAVSAGQIASVLSQLGCQKLSLHKKEDCPETDAFTAADAAAQRRIVEHVDKSDPTYRAQTVTDKFYEREVFERLHWPDPDLFADPLPPGAYNAQRIRNGQEPLWSKEMRDGFRKKDASDD